MSYSSEEDHNIAVETLGSTVQVEFDEATAVLDVLNVLPSCQSHPVTYQQPLSCVSTTSGKVSDARLINDHSAISANSMLNVDEKLLADDFYQNSEVKFEGPSLGLHDQDYTGKIKELHVYLDTVMKIARPGCSQEVLNVALSSMSSLVRILSIMSSKPELHASL